MHVLPHTPNSHNCYWNWTAMCTPIHATSIASSISPPQWSLGHLVLCWDGEYTTSLLFELIAESALMFIQLSSVLWLLDPHLVRQTGTSCLWSIGPPFWPFLQLHAMCHSWTHLWYFCSYLLLLHSLAYPLQKTVSTTFMGWKVSWLFMCWHLPPVFWVVRGVALDSLVGTLAVHLCWNLPPVFWVVRGVVLDSPVSSSLKSPPLLHFPVLLL